PITFLNQHICFFKDLLIYTSQHHRLDSYFILSTCPENRPRYIPCHLNEARVKVVSMFYHRERIDPLRIGVLFVELHICLLFIGKVYCCGDREQVSAVCRWLLCPSIP